MDQVYEIDCTTGEQTQRDLTPEEITQGEEDARLAAERAATEAQAVLAIDTQRAAVLGALATAAGVTTDDIITTFGLVPLTSGLELS